MSVTSPVRPGDRHAADHEAGKRLLIVAHAFPPENVAGALRPFRFSKSLPGCGYDVTVLTASPQPAGAPDNVHHIPQRRTFAEKVVRKFFLPGEDAIPWIGPAFRTAARLHAASPFSAVFSTSPPSPVHLVALRLKRRFGIPWVADFRDPMRGSSTRLQHAYPYLDRIFEPMIFRHAGAVIANTDAVADSWKRRYPEWAHKVTAIWNGFDPDEVVGPAPIPPRPYRVLGHFGEITAFRHPGALFASITRLIGAGRLDPTGLRIRLVGAAESAGDPEIFAALVARGVVETSPWVPLADAAAMMAEADSLLAIDITTGAPGLQVPSKLYTYIRVGRPVLAITSRNSPVERILARSGIPHACIHPDSPPEEVDRRVLDFLRLPSDPVRASDWFWENFDCTAQTRVLAAIIDGLPRSRTAAPVSARPL